MKALSLSPELYQYVVDHCPVHEEQLHALREETANLPNAGMQIASDQGSFLSFLVSLINAQNVLEVGCFTGYSSICMASSLPATGKLLTLDVSDDYTNIAKKYWDLCGLQDRIDLKLGPALDSLADLKANSFDLMFIDADKENMLNYYEAGLKVVRPGGLIIADNVLWGGSVINKDKDDAATRAIRDFNDKIMGDNRVDKTMLYLADGLYLIRRR